MEEVHLIVKIILSVAFLGAVSLLMHLYKTFWLSTEKLRRKLLMQGIKGPIPPSLFYGNVHEMQKIQMMVATKSSNHSDFIAHDYTATLFPYLEQWRKQYGQVYTYSTGMKQHLYVNKPDLVREINQCLTLGLGKPTYLTKRLAPMLGNGIMRSNGLAWSHQRKVIAPEFYMEKVKSMVGLMVNSTLPLLSKWENYIEARGGVRADIKVDEDLRGLTADVIAKACFGSSYDKGKEIFTKLRILQESLSNRSVLFGINYLGFFSMRRQRMLSSLEKETETLIWETVKERQRLCSEASLYEKDLLHLILEGADNNGNMDKESSKSFIVDNCKNIYFAGHDTVSVTSSWCLMLLALHPEWQARIREEVNQVFGDSLPDVESLSQLKTVTMVIQEGLRLYPPGAFVAREALEDIKIGNLTIPKGVCMWTLIPTVHRDTEIWGPDANEFKPERFSNGVSGACKIPQAYIPFGAGARLCLGRNFAMVQLKVILSLIVSKFSFTLSPKYKHYPKYNMIVAPGHGVHIIIQRISPGKPAQD